MSKIYANGVATVTLAANDKVAVFSYSETKVYQQVGYPNQPDSWDLVVANAANTSYTSSAFASGATLRIEASASDAFYEVGADPIIGDPTADISAADATFTVTGLAAAQGGSVTMRGGTSSTAGNAGGAALVTGGTPGVTGVGGAATIAAGLGGATSGAGGVASMTGGAGTAGNSAGGVSKIVGGAGQGSAAGGAAQVTGGAAGATGAGGAAVIAGAAGGATSGTGGAASLSAGAGTNGNANGGSVTVTAGAKNGSGLDGLILLRSPVSRKGVVATMTDTATIAMASILAGTVKCTPTAAATYTMPTGAVIAAALPADFTTGDSLDFALVNVATNDTFDITVATAASGTTMYGNLAVEANSATTKFAFGNFRIICTGAATYDVYRFG